MAFSRELFIQIKRNIRFWQAEKESSSPYTIIGNTLVRVSNHCTRLYVWDNILEKNPKWRGLPIISIVFEDNGSTFDEDCLVLRRNRRKPIKVNEFVYSLNGNPGFISKQDEKTIIMSIRNISNGNYIDQTNKSKQYTRISINPTDSNISIDNNGNAVYATGFGHGADYISENKQHKTNKTMKQRIIKLTESKLNRIIKEAVKRILKETTNPKTRVLDDNDWETLVCGDLNDEEALYDVIDKCKRNGITLDDIVNDYMCDKFCTERGSTPLT